MAVRCGEEASATGFIFFFHFYGNHAGKMRLEPLTWNNRQEQRHG